MYSHLVMGFERYFELTQGIGDLMCRNLHALIR